MLSQRDQIQAERFAQRRLESALVGDDPEGRDHPARRSAMWMYVGVLVAIVVALGMGFYGLVRPGGRGGWDEAGTLVVEQSTGTRYVYLSDQKLHPVLNYGSALLILGGQQIKTKEFSRESLAGVPRGNPVGTEGLPDSMPAAAGLIKSPWLVCSGITRDEQPRLTVVFGTDLQANALSPDRGLLVSSDTGDYLLWDGRRLRIYSDDVLRGLGYDKRSAIRVDARLLNVLAEGPDLHNPVPLMAGFGAPADFAIEGKRPTVGQVVVREDSRQDQFVVLKDGFAPVNPTQLAILTSDPAIARIYGDRTVTPQTVSSGEISRNPSAYSLQPPAGYPTDPPRLHIPDLTRRPAACATPNPSSDDGATTVPVVITQAPAWSEAVALHPAGGSILLETPMDADGTGKNYFFVGADGRAHPVQGGAATLQILGYSTSDAVAAPSTLVHLLPTGQPFVQIRDSTSSRS